MSQEKLYNPAEPITITLTMEQWQTVRHWLKSGTDYHRAKKYEFLAYCKDKPTAAQLAAQHEKAAAEAEALRKIIEAIIEPAPPAETE